MQNRLLSAQKEDLDKFQNLSFNFSKIPSYYSSYQDYYSNYYSSYCSSVNSYIYIYIGVSLGCQFFVKVVRFGFLLVIFWSLPKTFSSLLISSSKVVSVFEEHISSFLFTTFIVEGSPFTLFNSFNIWLIFSLVFVWLVLRLKPVFIKGVIVYGVCLLLIWSILFSILPSWSPITFKHLLV